MTNILEPIADAIISYCKWTYNVWFGNDSFNFKDFFMKVKLCNKDEEYPKVIKTYQGKKGKVYLITVPIGIDESHFKKLQRTIEIQLGENIEIRNKGHFIEIEIIEAKKRGNDTTSDYRPDINPFIIGTTLNREQLWQNISIRLKERLDEGMLDEVSSIHEDGISWERLEKLGLEYRYCSLFLQGKIATKDELFEQLFIAIRQFSKRQQTWFRMMEKKGVKIHWLEPESKEARINQALQLISKESFD